MLTRRDLLVALTTAVTTGTVFVALAQAPGFIGSSVWDWKNFNFKPSKTGGSVSVANGPTATLENLEMHITKLNPGERPHPPHHHPNEELIIIRQGTVETLTNGHWVRVGPGSIIFNGSNQVHDLRNVGTDQAIYHVVNVKTDKTPAGSTVMDPDIQYPVAP